MGLTFENELIKIIYYMPWQKREKRDENLGGTKPETKNDNKNDNKEWIVNGYSFETEEEYQKALEEKKSIERLMKKVNLDKKELLVALYSGLVTQNKLSTVVGLEYLCRLRDVIVNKKYAKASELPPIQTGAFKTEKAVGYKLSDAQQKLDAEKRETEKYKIKSRNLLILSVALFIVIGIMMYIATTGDNINVINYEHKLVDKYASWESRLTQREQQVREAEKRLGIE